MRLFRRIEKIILQINSERTEKHGRRFLSLMLCLCIVISIAGVTILANAVASAAPAATAETQTREVDVNAYPDGMTVSFDVDTSTAADGWLYYWGNESTKHYTGVELKDGQITAIYKKANNNPIPAGALEPGVNHHITVTYTAIPTDGTSQLIMALYVDGRKIGEFPRLGSFFDETLTFTYTVPEITIDNGIKNEHQIAVDAGIAPKDIFIWFDATLGNGVGDPYNAAVNRIATYDFIKNGDGSWSVKLPGPDDVWKNTSVTHDYTLAGWYDIYSKEYYKPGETVSVNALGNDESHNTVFYADWWAADYNFNDDTKETLPNGRFDRGNSFISTTVFDYNELYNTTSANVSSTQLDESGHKETWTATNERIAFSNYRKSSVLNPSGLTGMNKSQGSSGDNSVVFPGKITSDLWEKGVKELFENKEPLPMGVKCVGEGNSLYQYNRTTGFYYYDSRLNAASYDQSQNKFHVYNTTESVTETGTKSAFVPFNKGKESYDSGSEVNYWFGFSSEINFSLQYALTDDNINSGKVNMAERSNGSSLADMVFTFAGDDDVYVFIDDELWLDMGGIHDVVFGEINFTKGTVTYGQSGAAIANTGEYGTGVPPTVTAGSGVTTQKYISELEAGDHTLRICYMERGAGGSNCAIYFNIQPEMRQQIYKVDEDGNGIAGTEFTLYAAKEGSAYISDKQHHEAKEFEIADSKPITVVTTREGEFDPTKPSEMQDKGYADLVGENGKNINFRGLANDGNIYYILRETGTNPEYRGLLKDVVLKFDPDLSTFEVVNQFEVGAYASFNTIMTDSQDALYFASLNENGTTSPDTAHPITTTDQEDSLLFAVPLIKITQNGQVGWYPVYGSNTQGFTIVNIYSSEDYPGADKNSAAAKSWALRHNIMATVLRQAASKVAPDWVYQFDENISKFTATFQNLPGNPMRYVANNKDDPSKADIVLAGFMVDGGSLISLVQGIDNKVVLEGMDDAEKYAALQNTLNSWSEGNWATVFDERIAEDPNGRGDSWKALKNVIDTAYREGSPETDDYNYGYNLVDISGFERYYSSTIYIPNEIRDLRIQKRDQYGNGLNGAQFSLFGSFEDAVNGDNALATGKTGVVNGTNGVLLLGPKDVDDDSKDGGFVYVNWETQVGHGEGDGGRTFWIKETQAPEGYEVNPSIIQVYVGEQTIYANASGYKAGADGKPVLIDDYSDYYTNGENDKGKLENLQSGTKYNTDGVSVRSSVGKLFQSMAKYADMIVDSTLVDITARDYIFVNTEDSRTQLPEGVNKPYWSFAGENGKENKHNFNLHYWGDAMAYVSSDYSSDHNTAGSKTGIYASTNNGFMYLRPTQTPSKNDVGFDESTNPFSYEENHPDYKFSTRRTSLRESDGSATDISDLFSPSTVVVVEDVKTGTLTVEKQIENADDDRDPKTDFDFTVELKTPVGKAALQKDLLSAEKISNGESAETPLTWTEVKDGEGNVTGFKTEFKLKHGESIKISGLIYGTDYTVCEKSASGYKLLDVKNGEKESVTFDAKALSTVGKIGETEEGSGAEANAHRIFVNEPTGTLTVEKYIHNDDRWTVSTAFEFKVTLTAEKGKYLDTSALTVMKFKKTEGGSETSESVADWKWEETKTDGENVTEVTAAFSLQHGERIVIGEIPYGTEYKAAETKSNGYYLEHVADNPKDEVGSDGKYLKLNLFTHSVSGTVAKDNKDAYLFFNNSKPFLPFTGGFGVEIFYCIGAVLLLGSIVILAVRRRKRRLHI